MVERTGLTARQVERQMTKASYKQQQMDREAQLWSGTWLSGALSRWRHSTS